MTSNNSYSAKKILITGGLGFIGSRLVHRLVNLGGNVTVVDSLIPEYGGNLYNVEDIKNKVRINISDVRDQHSFKYLVLNQDFIFNLAGQTSHMDSMTDPFNDLAINTEAQLSILETCRKYNPGVKIVYASTRQVYGKPEYLPVDEKHPIKPVDVNGINKLAGEWYHILYHNVYDLKATSLRLTNTYGPAMRIKDSRQTFLGVWMRRIIEKESFEIWGGEQLRDFNYVEDVVDALLLAGLNKVADGKIYNLGSEEKFSLTELADIIRSVWNEAKFKVIPFPPDRKKIDIGDYYSNYSLIRNELGWQPKIDFKEGIKATLDFYQANLDKYL